MNSMPQERMNLAGDAGGGGVANPAAGSTERSAFSNHPSLALRKFAVTCERAAAVHEGFSAEVAEMGEHIASQEALAVRSLESCRALIGPLSTLADSIGRIAETAGRSRALVREGREGLSASVERVKAAIEAIRRRSEEMRSILSFSERITQRVGDIADIAVENKVIAINASITASKASDRVRGFKVIAQEITKMSAAMADRVEIIVAAASGIGGRVSRILSFMDESIRTTEDALRRIDEAFSLLADIDATIVGTESEAARMRGEGEALARERGSLETSLEAVREAIGSAKGHAGAAAASAGAQRGHLEGLAAGLTGAERDAAALARAAAGATEGARTLVMTEVPIRQYDPALATLVREYHYVNFTCIRLLRYSSDRKLVPYLADYWILLPDGKTWEFQLKTGVRFFDGSPVTAEDVRFSLERVLHPGLGSPYANLLSVIAGAEAYRRGEATRVEGIKVLGPQRIRFELTSPFNYFLGLLAHSFSSILKRDPSRLTRPLEREEVMSAGPFRSMVRSSPDCDSLAVNPDFVNGPAFFDRLEIKRDVTDLAGALVAGAVQFAYNVPARLESELKGRGFRGQYQYYVSRYCNGIVVNFRRDTWAARRPELRRAMVMALDKDAILREVYGDAAVRADSVLTRDVLDTGGKPIIPFDPEGARRIVASFRGSERLEAELSLAVVRNPTMLGADRICELVARALGEVGLKVRVSVLDASQASVEEYRKYDLVFLRFMPELDLYAAFEPFVNPEGGDNYLGYDNPEMQERLGRSISIRDDAERRRYFQGFVEEFTRDVFMVPLFFLKVMAVSNPDLRTVVLSPEESFFPELMWRDPGLRSLAGGAAAREAAAAFDRTARGLEGAASAVAQGSGALAAEVEETMAAIHGQRREIEAAEGGIRAIEERADLLREGRDGVVNAVRAAAAEAQRSAEAARMILAGLERLGSGLRGTADSLEAVRRSVAEMLAVVAAIEGYNSVIGSVAVNAAIIATKAESRGSDLRKVSQSIGELARVNGENARAIAAILKETEKNVLGHAAGIGAALAEIEAASAEVGSSGAVLEEAGPVLAAAEEYADRIRESSDQALRLTREASAAVSSISQGAAAATGSAETLRFGLDIERAIVAIVADHAGMLRDFSALMERLTREGAPR